MTRRDTPVISHGSGEFLRDQSADHMRQRCDTMAECPAKGCAGGQIRTSSETATGYRVTIKDCTFCGGVGVVPKWKVA